MKGNEIQLCYRELKAKPKPPKVSILNRTSNPI